jgi:hypothetical protein
MQEKLRVKNAMNFLITPSRNAVMICESSYMGTTQIHLKYFIQNCCTPIFYIQFPYIYSCLFTTIRIFAYHCEGLNCISGIMANMLASDGAVVVVIV